MYVCTHDREHVCARICTHMRAKMLAHICREQHLRKAKTRASASPAWSRDGDTDARSRAQRALRCLRLVFLFRNTVQHLVCFIQPLQHLVKLLFASRLSVTRMMLSCSRHGSPFYTDACDQELFSSDAFSPKTRDAEPTSRMPGDRPQKTKKRVYRHRGAPPCRYSCTCALPSGIRKPLPARRPQQRAASDAPNPNMPLGMGRWMIMTEVDMASQGSLDSNREGSPVMQAPG